MFACPESRPTITKQAETNASIYAGMVPCAEGISKNDVSGIKRHQSAINQLGSPFIGLKYALIPFTLLSVQGAAGQTSSSQVIQTRHNFQDRLSP